jgi:predicted DNA-binding transcriptional regulator AlpA
VDTTGWVGADRAAEILGITRKSVYDYALRLTGFPQPERIGRTVLWREKDLLAWRKAHPSRKRGQ